MPRRSRLLALALAAAALGCGEPASPRRPGPQRRASDKAALFGDPSLVPTRDGERARREVALAQEIEAALGVLPSVARARVDVELAERPAAARVLAVVAGDPGADADALAARVRTVAHTVMGPQAAVEVVAEPIPAPAPPAEPPPRWPLLLGVLGLGFFGGTLIERIRGLRRRGAARRRRP